MIEHISKYLWNILFSLLEFLSIFILKVAQTAYWPMHLFSFLESRSNLLFLAFFFPTQITLKPLLNTFINVSFWLFFYKAGFSVSSLFSWLFSDAWWILNYFLNEAIISNFLFILLLQSTSNNIGRFYNSVKTKVYFTQHFSYNYLLTTLNVRKLLIKTYNWPLK